MNIFDVEFKTKSGHKKNLGECTDEEFEEYISSFCDIIESTGEWTKEGRQQVMNQINNLLEQIFKESL